MGSVGGPFSCTNGLTGTGLMFEIEAGLNTLSARLQLSYNGCSESAYFGGVRLR